VAILGVRAHARTQQTSRPATAAGARPGRARNG
jgi:hypothetical protein